MAHGPTHKFCPRCGAMLPPDLQECPRCGQNLSHPASVFSNRDIVRITGMVLLVAAVPLVIVILTAVICTASAR